MGRAANALDWTEAGSGVGLRALIAYPSERPDSELRLREETPASRVDDDDEEPPTHRLPGNSAFDAREEEPSAGRGIARLSALADWIDGEEPSGAVVTLVRAFLRDVEGVGRALEALASAGDAWAGPELAAAIQSLALAIGMWRSNLVEHVDDLALSDHRSFSGWSSLPEYSSAFTLAIVRPALAEADAWATAAAVRGDGDLGPLVRAVASSVDALNATLRTAILGPSDGDEDAGAGWSRERSLVAAAW